MTNVFDLKGSTVDRFSLADASTLKDVNFLKMISQNPKFLDIPQKHAQVFYKILSKDVAFLKRCGLMDYSLLLGTEKSKNPYGSVRMTTKNTKDSNQLLPM